jgi:hypothetical protein
MSSPADICMTIPSSTSGTTSSSCPPALRPSAPAGVLLTSDHVYEWASSHHDQNVSNYAALLRSLGCSSTTLLREDVLEDLVEGGIPKMAAKDILASFRQHIATFAGEVAVFWDLENIAIRSGSTATSTVKSLRYALSTFGVMHGSIYVYGARDMSSKGYETIRADLTANGCHLIDTPHDGKKEMADKMLIADVLLWAMDHPPPAKIVLLTGDEDMSYIMHRLRAKGFKIVLVLPSGPLPRLRAAASMQIMWERDVLGLSRRPVQLSARNPFTAVAYGGRPDIQQTPQIAVASSNSIPTAAEAVPSDSIQLAKDGSRPPSETQHYFEDAGLADLIECLSRLEERTGQEWLMCSQVGVSLNRWFPLLRKQYPAGFGELFDLAVSMHIVDRDIRMPSSKQPSLRLRDEHSRIRSKLQREAALRLAE